MKTKPSGVRTKCTRWDFCDSLRRSISDTHRGVYINVLFALNKGKETGLVATLYSGEFGSRGAIMGFYPFCGQKLGRLPTSEQRQKHRDRQTKEITIEFAEHNK
jgi:hypothetical protein